MKGHTIDFNRYVKHEFDFYVQTHEATYNSMQEKTMDASDLLKIGNEQVSYY